MSVEELEGYFKDRQLPAGPVKINKFSTIIDPKAFVESELYILSCYPPGTKLVDSCRLRLLEFKEWLDAHVESRLAI
ncbi:DUF6965 family protein [Dyadobacter alkalitolerans]|uniref:DUF6965 family protein n=1 Tax=Dyadobacter alkalitolerans TaxID=492736 RepID=UPI00047B4464